MNLSLVSATYAAITLTNGYWSTSFSGCAVGNVSGNWVCDGLELDDWAYTCNGTYSQVLSAANNSSGDGGNGYRGYYLGGSRNTESTALKIMFSTPQPEFWLRFYYRIPSGQRNTGLPEHKIIFPTLNSGISSPVNWPAQSDISMTMQGTMGGQDIYFSNGGGWDDIYGGPARTTPADGSWHYFEFHFKLGTRGGNNGVFQMWVDGVNYANRSNLDWFNGGAANSTGWTRILFPHNHNVFALSGCNGHDVDDIAVATPAYAKFTKDAGGRNMIGPIRVSPPTGLHILD